MGWTYHYNIPRDPREEIADLCTSDTHRPLAIGRHGSTYYAAVEFDGKGVFCTVFLTRTSKGEWGYKAIDERSGPVEANCPQMILKQLSPLNDENDPNGWARNWRDKCAQALTYKRRRARIKSGQKIKLTRAVKLTNGKWIDTFEVQTIPGYTRRGKAATRFYNPHCGHVRLDRFHLEPGWETLP